MDTHSTTEALRLLVLLQLAMATVSAIEALLVGAFTGGMFGPGALTAVGALLTWWAYRSVDRRHPKAPKRIRRLQYGWLVFAAVDMALSAFLLRRGLEPVPTVTRIGLPIAILVVVRRPSVKADFVLAGLTS